MKGRGERKGRMLQGYYVIKDQIRVATGQKMVRGKIFKVRESQGILF